MKLKSGMFYIYGGGIFGESLVKYFKSKGIIPAAIFDKNPKNPKYPEFLDVPCVKFPDECSSFNVNYPVLQSILGYEGIAKALLDEGFVNIVSTKNVFDAFPSALSILNQCGFLWMKLPVENQVSLNDCKKLYGVLSDFESKKILNKLVDYRINPSSKSYPWPSAYRMYFPSDIPLLYADKELRILDVGAYDGDTMQDFLIAFKNEIKSYTAVDVSPKNLSMLRSRLDGISIDDIDIQLVQAAVGVPIDSCLFVEERGSATKVSFGFGEDLTSGEKVQTRNLGELLESGRFNVLKMDIEGADYAALCEAASYIRDRRPTLALSVYHTPDDLWRIPLLIDEIAPDGYKMYLRQEGHWGLETQFYAVPT